MNTLYHGSLFYRENGSKKNYHGDSWTVDSDGIVPICWPRVFLGNLHQAIEHATMLKLPPGIKSGYTIVYSIDAERLPDLREEGHSWTTSHIPHIAIIGDVQLYRNGDTPRDVQYKLQKAAKRKGWV